MNATETFVLEAMPEPESGAAVRCTDLLARMVELAVGRINSAIQQYQPKLVVALFSGGHDSLSAVTMTSRASRFDGCLHVNTGIGIEATREYVRATCSKHHWPLAEYHALENTKADGTPDPMDFVKEVMKVGFPGPPQHYIMYIKLKQRSIERYLRDVGATPDSPVLFVTGARTCLCGAFADKGELEELGLWPQTRPCYDRIIKLQEAVIAAGFPWGWEDRPPKWFEESGRGQAFMLEYDENEAWGQPMCHKCNHGAMRANDQAHPTAARASVDRRKRPETFCAADNGRRGR